MKIYLPGKLIFTEAAMVDKSLCLPIFNSITVLLCDFSTMNEFSTFKDFLTSFGNCY